MSDVPAAAAALRARGFAITFLAPGEKRPTHKRWTAASQEPGDYRPGYNLGIMTGVLSGDLVCIDIDSPEALALADQHLPPTGMIDGRPSKPRSHRWYRVTDIPPAEVFVPTAKHSSPPGGPRTHLFAPHVEFRGTGGQAVVPPSVHPSGECRVWDADGEPAVLPYAVLRSAYDALCSALGRRPPGRPRKTAAPSSPPPASPLPSGSYALRQ